MKISNNALAGIVLGSFVSMVGSCGSSLYISRPTPEDEQMLEIQKGKYSVTEMAMGCVPREKNTSISDKCLDLVQRYDSVRKEEAALENSPAYASSQQRKKYSNYLILLTMLSMATGIVSSKALRKRSEENKSKGEQ